jgi:predicted metal-dependent peptidase
MSQEAKSALAKAKINLATMKNNTFFTALVFQLPFHINSQIPTACTDGTKVMFNPDFVLGMSKEQLMFLILHEILHVAYDHMGNHGFEHDRWNRACDYCINDQLIKLGYSMPAGGLHDSKYSGMAPERIYHLLEEEDSSKNKGKGKPSPWDDLATPAEPDNHKRTEAIKGMLVAAATQAKMANDAGSIPGDIARLVDNILNPVVPWYVVLRRFMNEQNKADYSWSKPNKRFIPEHYLPSLHSNTLERIDFAIDVSGSINEEQFKQFIGELYHVLRRYKPKKLGIMQFDHIVQSSNVLSNARQLLSLPFKGGGGTYLEPVMQEFNKSVSKTLIVLTDGYFSTNITRPKGKVIWIVYNNKEFVPPFGTAIHFTL